MWEFLWEEEAKETDAEEASKALVEQLMREELSQPPTRMWDDTAAMTATAESDPDENPMKDIRTLDDLHDFIYQLCLRLDDVNVDVKTENWKVLAPHVIDQLPLFCYDCRTTTASNNEDNQCLVCLTEYEQGEQLRKLPKCGHFFHQHCVDPWLLQHDMCPICRTTIDED